MGVIRDLLAKGIGFVGEEILPLRSDLIKAGILTPDAGAFDPKASLVDPMSFQGQALGYKEKWSILDYARCRQITYTDPVVAAIIQVRLNQVAASAMPQSDKYKVGYKIKLRDNERVPTGADKKKAKEIEKFIQYCGVPENFEDTPERRRRDSFETFLRKITRDSLTFDQINFEVTPRNNGLPYSFQAVDASTIRMISDQKEIGETFGGRAPKAAWYQGMMPNGGNTEFKEFKPSHPRYAQVINGVIHHIFDEWEMAFGVRNPRTDLLAMGYGFSEIEMLVTTITAHINAEAYNRRFFSQGSTIKGILTFEGTVPPDQLEAFRRQWYQQVTGVTNAFKTPIMSLGKDSKLNWLSLHSTNREMEFGKWMEYCIKTIAGVFQIDPIEIGFDISRQGAGQNSSTGGLNEGNQSERIAYSQDKGLRPLLRHIQSLINEYVVYRLDPNFEFEFVGLNSATEKDDLDKAIQQVKSFKTINEIRAEHDLKAIKSFDDVKSPFDLILDPSVLQAWTQAQASQQPEGGDAPAMAGGDSEGVQAGSGEAANEEPDYENMSLDELRAEYDRLTQGSAPQAQRGDVKKARFIQELDL